MDRRTMMTTLAGGAAAVGYVGRAKAAPAAKGNLPVASADAAKDFSGAKELPNPHTDYKVVFSVAAKVKDDEVHPTLKMIGLYLNTLTHNGVPAKNRHIAAMFHQGGGDAVFSNEVYKARHSGVAMKLLAPDFQVFAVAGRGFDERDQAASPPVLIVNESLARRVLAFGFAAALPPAWRATRIDPVACSGAGRHDAYLQTIGTSGRCGGS